MITASSSTGSRACWIHGALQQQYCTLLGDPAWPSTLWVLRASAPIPSKTGGDLCDMHDFSALAAKFLSPHNGCILEGEMSGDQPHMTLHRLLDAWLSDAEGLL